MAAAGASVDLTQALGMPATVNGARVAKRLRCPVETRATGGALPEGDQLPIGGIRFPEYLRPTYANYVNVNHTPWDFRLTFGVLKSPMPGTEVDQAQQAGAVEPEAVADLILPANLMHGLIGALKQGFDRYIEQYGAPGLNPEGPEQRE
jgi:hypothetical protein